MRIMMIKRERTREGEREKETIKQTGCCVVSSSHFAANNC